MSVEERDPVSGERKILFAPAGGACVDSAANYLTFNPPTITSIPLTFETRVPVSTS